VTVADTASAVIANGGLTGAATFTVNSLTFGGAATFTPVLSAPGAAPAVATATLVNGSGLVTVNPSVLAATPTWAAGTYDLLSSGSAPTLGAFSLVAQSSILKLRTVRQSAVLALDGNALALVVTGGLPIWTGADDGVWATAPDLVTPFHQNWSVVNTPPRPCPPISLPAIM